METEKIGTTSEYEVWLSEHKDAVMGYIAKNDVMFKDMQMSARAYNALRLAGKNSMGDIVFEADDAIAEIEMIGPAVDEVCMYKRNFLRKHKKAILDYVTNGFETKNDGVNDEQRAPMETVVSKEKSNDAVSTYAENAATESACEFARRALLNDPYKVKIQEFFQKKKVSVDNMSLSARSNHALRKNNIDYLDKALPLYPDKFYTIRNLGRKSIDEICFVIEGYVSKYWQEISQYVENGVIAVENETEDNGVCDNPLMLSVKELLFHPNFKEKATNFLKENAVALEDMGLSVRAFNAFHNAGAQTFLDALDFYPDRLMKLSNVGVKTLTEIEDRMELYLARYTPLVQAYCNGDESVLYSDEQLKNTVMSCLEKVDFIGVSFAEIREKFSETIDEHRIKKCIGQLIAEHSLEYVDYRLYRVYPSVFDFVAPAKTADVTESLTSDNDELYDNDLAFALQRLLVEDDEKNVESEEPFSPGLLTEDGNEIDELEESASNAITSVDYLSEDEKRVVRLRLSGMTLDEIGAEYGVTRERARQKFTKSLKRLRNRFRADNGFCTFDEDYFAYLFSHYNIDKTAWIEHLNVSKNTYNYLMATQKRGEQDLQNALEDDKIALSLKFKIRDYLNRNKIIIDGVLIEKQRKAIENYVLSKYCRDEVSFDDFVGIYNKALQSNGLDFDDKLFCTDEVKQSRKNRLAESDVCLYKNGEKLRYYDIPNRDYSELLDTLHLDSFHNTEISTLKFITAYPELMKKYDIRDQYELHNLLKKIVDTDCCDEIVFGRQPTIRFGTFDRTEAIRNIITMLSPVSAENLADYLFLEFGYDRATAVGYLAPLKSLYHEGVYSVSFKQIPDSRTASLDAALTEEFYPINDVKKIYTSLFPDADVEEINPRSLKMMGYTVFSGYILKTYSTADEYFYKVLTEPDFIDYDIIKKKYSSLSTVGVLLSFLRRENELLLYENNRYINFRRLDKMGITKEDLSNYVNQAADFADENAYFTLHSLQQNGFESNLDALGFDAPFYESLLAMSGKFEYTQIFGKMVLYKGTRSEKITKKSFILDELALYDSVSVEDFIEDCMEKYGLNISDRYDITSWAIEGTEYYYDSIMGKIYRNKNYYYAEFDD